MLRFIVLLTSIFLLSIPHWIKQTFGVNIATDQILFHLLGGRNALIGTEFSIYKSFYDSCIITPICITMILSLASYVIFYKAAPRFSENKIFKALYSKKADFAVLLISMTSVAQLIHVDYLKTNFGEDILTPAYVSPSKINYTSPRQKKNLLLIYFESLEYNLQNPKVQGANLIKAIDKLSGTNMLMAPAPGTEWSIAGMVSSQCSFPLKVFFADSKIKQTMFFPGAICLGDVLKEQGYKQYFLVGADLKFTRRDLFYKDHGYDFAYGLKEWKQMGLKPELFTGWGKGLQDDTLFEQAEKIIVKNSALNQPYNLTLITTDTHFPEGFASPRCSDREKSTGYKGAFQCSSQFLANFLNDLNSKRLLDNTVVIIMGDHRFMNNPRQEKYFPKPRNVYFKIINPDHNKKVTREMMTSFDVAPTILDSLGLSNSPNTQFGLGVSIYSEISASDYSKKFDKAMNENILNRSKTYDSFWEPRGEISSQ